jgi:NAD(P)-dependent dehydrogenase (short-subunit alcohol dehydrogenase family)/pimeloyl-ACP methyl ester carboxylesterase
MAVTERFVSNGDVQIAVYEQGKPDGPTVVLTHGWPDSHTLWDSVVPQLTDRFRVITYDNRGVGASSSPRKIADYAMTRYAEDFAAVVDAVSPGVPVHVLGHDWGSIAVWEYLYLHRDDAAGRVASFTSVSGPSLDHLAAYVLDNLRKPYRFKRFLWALDQAIRISYPIPFSLGAVLPVIVRLICTRRSFSELIKFTEGTPPDRIHHGATFTKDAANSMKVYPANFFHAIAHVRRDHHVDDVPVQLIVNMRDEFVRRHSYDDESRWVSRLWRREISAGHWAPFSHPRVLASAVADMVDVVDGKPPSRAMRRAQVGPQRSAFGDMLVSVTGAGSGIGRATALEFARLGAEVVVSDIAEGSVRETAAQIEAHGGTAHAYTLDVADAAAVEAFAEEVCEEHGVPDIVVNNAGVGQAGRFLDTPAEQWDKVLDVNLGGVVNGCRSFASRLVERGTGGHIVNIASAAAFAPLQSLNAYCTSKAAVYMFSDCLRAELDSAGIGLTTVCPGPVHTNIVAAASFDPAPGRRSVATGRRKQWEKLFEARRYSPEKAAKAIVSAVQKNKPIRPVTPEAYLLYGTSRLAPQALRSTARGQVI